MNSIVSNILASGNQVTLVPFLSVSPISCTSPIGIHLSYLCLYILPFLCTTTSNRSANAFTTDAPTPCKPHDILYADFSNLPPAWSIVNTISNADFPVLGCLSTGIHLPLSCTVTVPSACMMVVICVQCPASASSTALSTISWIVWCKPLMSVVPMYIPGLCLTGSNPSKTLICEASYCCSFKSFSVAFVITLTCN